MTGLEPASFDWKSNILPLNYNRNKPYAFLTFDSCFCKSKSPLKSWKQKKSRFYILSHGFLLKWIKTIVKNRCFCYVSFSCFCPYKKGESKKRTQSADSNSNRKDMSLTNYHYSTLHGFFKLVFAFAVLALSLWLLKKA